MNKIQEAMKFARMKHSGHSRDDGKPYFTHLMAVYKLVKMVTNDQDILCASLLHDTLEDTETTYNELRKNFGKVIADLVKECTTVNGKYPYLKSQKAFVIKFADKLHNISDMKSWNKEKKRIYLEIARNMVTSDFMRARKRRQKSRGQQKKKQKHSTFEEDMESMDGYEEAGAI